MPEQEGVASIENPRAVPEVEEGQVVGDLADDGVSDKLANLRSRHSDLTEFCSVGTTLGRLDKTFEDTRVRDGGEGHRDGVRQLLGDLVEVAVETQIWRRAV